MVDYYNLKFSQTSSGKILVKHSNGNAIKFNATKKKFSTSKSIQKRLEYFDKYGVMVGYKS